MILYTLYRKNYFFIHFENINLVNIRYSKHCVSLSRKRLAVHVLGRGGRYALPHRIEFDPLFPPPTGFGNNEEKRISESKASSILRYFSVYMERAHVNLLWIFRITRNTWRISPPPTSEHKGKFSQARKKFIQTRCGQRDFKTFGRRRARKLVGYTATRVATELFVVYCNKLWWTAEPASLM